MQKRPKAREGFTLVELLVVIAITAVLFALLLVPLVQAVRLTQRAQIVAAAQDSARKTLEQVAREAGSAVYVFDNASHPLTSSSGTFAAGDDTFTNFLNLQVVKSDGSYAVAHAYNAKLDLVPARHTGDVPGGPTDPTTGGNDPIELKSGVTGSASLEGTGALFPLAPGSTIIRYFIGLKRPAVNYANSNEKLNGNANPGEDNAYVLYRAQVAPYTYTSSGTGAATTYTRTANSLYFDTGTDGKPELDDPDFFRYVTGTDKATPATPADVNWLSSDHHLYTGPEASAHNTLVDNWVKIAKPVITAPAIDLLIVPHNPDGTVAFDANNVPSSGSTTDPVPTTPVQYPTVKTSVTFAPATLTADAAPSNTTAYGEEGVPADAADNSGLPYVPTVYTASDQSWGYPYNLSLFQYTSTGSALRYDTDLAGANFTANNLHEYAGDLIEYYHPDTGSSVAVYDITQGVVLQSSAPHNYVPLIVNPDTGTINFAAPALPAPANMNTGVSYNLYTRFWSVPYDMNIPPTLPTNVSLNDGTLLACNGTPGVIDLTKLYADSSGSGVLVTTGGYNASPLSNLGIAGTAMTNPIACANAFLVPGSVRVYGPDATPGPNLGNSVLYSPIPPGMPLSFNQYRLDMLNGTLTFFVTDTEQLPITKADGVTPADPVRFAFDYQANVSALDPTQAVSSVPDTANNKPANPARPLQVKVDYQTRDLLDVNIGVRVYDPTDGHALTIPQSTRVQIGNPNR